MKKREEDNETKFARKIIFEELLHENEKFWLSPTKSEIEKYTELFGNDIIDIIPLILIKVILSKYIDIDDPLIIYFLNRDNYAYYIERLDNIVDDIELNISVQKTKTKITRINYIEFASKNGSQHYSEIPQGSFAKNWNLFMNMNVPYRIIMPQPSQSPHTRLRENGMGIYASRFYPSIVYHRPGGRPCINISGLRYQWIIYTNAQGFLDRDPDEGPALQVYYKNNNGNYKNQELTDPHDFSTINITIYAKNGLLQSPKNQTLAAFHQEIKIGNNEITEDLIKGVNTQEISLWADKGILCQKSSYYYSYPSLINYNFTTPAILMNPITPSNSPLIISFALLYLRQEHIIFNEKDNSIKFNPHSLYPDHSSLDHFQPNICFPLPDDLL
jgi:hypothetical protein